MWLLSKDLASKYMISVKKFWEVTKIDFLSKNVEYFDNLIKKNQLNRKRFKKIIQMNIYHFCHI